MNEIESHIWHPFTQMKTHAKFPKITHAKGSYLFTEDGFKLLDMISSWWVTLHGHSNEYIADCISKQTYSLEQVIFADFIHEPAKQLISRLQKILPKELEYFFFSDDGSTAVEVALKMAIQFFFNSNRKEKVKFIAFENGYHGDTIGALSLGSKSTYKNPFKKLCFKVFRSPFPDTFEKDNSYEEKESKAIAELEEILIKNYSKIAAMIVEPLIQGAGGMRMCKSSFLEKLKNLSQKYEVLLIFDEVMTGFGRTGDFFASTKSKVTPDIICLSKGLTGGFLPMALTVATKDIYESFYSHDLTKTFFHGHSYTGSPLGCAAAVASFDLLEKRPFDNIEIWHKENMQNLYDHPMIKKHRITGTIAAFDLKIKSKKNLVSDGKKLQKMCFEKGVYIRPMENVVYLLPPYSITKEELSFSYKVILENLNKLNTQ